jgi:hypothetical protein
VSAHPCDQHRLNGSPIFTCSVWYPTIQFTCKIFDPKTGERIWKSVNVSNFVTPPPGLDKRSCKADEFSITHKTAPGTDFPESYTIRANLAADLQVSFDITRPASIPGCKLGKGPKGGYTYFGPDQENADGYVVHRFWPRFNATGHVIHAGKASTLQGPGVFIHAIQGMRPNLVASAWNFADFHSDLHGGVSAIQMEFKTCDSHGRKGAGSGGVYVNVGSLVIGGKLVSMTAETKWPDEEPTEKAVISRATHLNVAPDPETGYKIPTEILFEWQGPSVITNVPGPVKAKVQFGVGTVEAPKGLIEKVDVLAEIPYVVKIAVNYVAGTKPVIYQVRDSLHSLSTTKFVFFIQWINPATLTITGPDSLLPGLLGGLEVPGTMYNEATFIS